MADPRLTGLMAAALGRLGTRHALVVSGHEGLDEISISGPTTVCEMADGVTRTYQITPEEVGLSRAPLEAVLGGTAAENAAIIRDLFACPCPSPCRDIVALNAGAGLVVCEVAVDLKDGVRQALSVIESGKALEKLDQWIHFSQWQATS